MLLAVFVALSPILIDIAGATNFKRVTCPGGQSTTNEACCVFFELGEALQTDILEGDCGIAAAGIIQLAIVDAVGFSKSGQFQGNGADGSIITFASIETKYPSNIGTSVSVDELLPVLEQFSVTPGDILQFAAAVALSNCAGAPRIPFLAGRPNATIPASDGTVFLPTESVTAILSRMADVGFSPSQVVALLASHSVLAVTTSGSTGPFVAFDTTPTVFDGQFFLEVLLAGTGLPASGDIPGEVESPLPAEGEVRIQSDFAIARDARTSCIWQGFVNNQALLMNSFASAMEALSVVGHNPSTLIDCSDTVPVPVPPAQKSTSFPAGTGPQDIQHACAATPFPTLPIDPGPPTAIPFPPSEFFR